MKKNEVGVTFSFKRKFVKLYIYFCLFDELFRIQKSLQKSLFKYLPTSSFSTR